MDILRFITAGNIDDGKSTLTGRLLLETGNIKSDILDSLAGSGEGRELNLAHVTDGLRAERREGITIDVAYKYFTTAHRKYIITDAPGHFQYTRNLVTGASGVDLMIILVDAVNGITSQTRRHSQIASFLKTGHVVVAINKMDLVAYDEKRFQSIRESFVELAKKLGLPHVSYIPVSALKGDNVTTHSLHMPWYHGHHLLQFLEKCQPRQYDDAERLRYVVQYASGKYHYGKVLSGSIQKGDTLFSVVSGKRYVVDRLVHEKGEQMFAHAGQNIGVVTKASAPERGDLLSHMYNEPVCGQELEAELCWLDDTAPLAAGKQYTLRIGTAETACTIEKIIFVTDHESFGRIGGRSEVQTNEFATIRIRTEKKLAFDSYEVVRATGRGILIDRDTQNTSGALIVR